MKPLLQQPEMTLMTRVLTVNDLKKCHSVADKNLPDTSGNGLAPKVLKE